MSPDPGERDRVPAAQRRPSGRIRHTQWTSENSHPNHLSGAPAHSTGSPSQRPPRTTAAGSIQPAGGFTSKPALTRANYFGRSSDTQGMTPPRSDAEIIAASVAEPERFGEIFDRHNADIYSFVRQRSGDQAADELLADVFVAAFVVRMGYRPHHPTCRPWLYGIASNLVVDRHRADMRTARTLRAVQALTPSTDPGSDHPCDTQMPPELTRALLKLRAQDREVLVLYAWADLDYSEISTALEIPVGTVRSRLHRARSTVRRSLGLPGDSPTITSSLSRGETHVP
jgi:RNA polymerase sigma factor (sigma-70 family)